MNKLYTYYLFLSVHFLSSWRHMTLSNSIGMKQNKIKQNKKWDMNGNNNGNKQTIPTKWNIKHEHLWNGGAARLTVFATITNSAKLYTSTYGIFLFQLWCVCIHEKFPNHCLSATSYAWRSCYSWVYLSKNVTLSNFGCILTFFASLILVSCRCVDCDWQKQPNNASFLFSLFLSLCCNSYLYKYLIWFLNSSSTSENA